MSKHDPIIKSVGIFPVPHYWYFHIEMCKQLKERHNCKITIYVNSKENIKFVQDTLESKFYNDIVVRNFQASPYKDVINEEAVFKQSRDWEAYLSCNYTELVMANRMFGRGYSLGGYYHARSYASEMHDHVRVTDIYNEEISFWKNEFEKKQTDLFINPSKIQFVLGKKMRIPMRMMYASRHENYFYWAEDEYGLNTHFEGEFKKIDGNGLKPVEKNTGYAGDMVFRKGFFQRYGLRPFVKNTLRRIFRFIIHQIKGDPEIPSRYVISNTIRHWRTYTDGHKMLRGKYITPLEQLKDKKFLYFPLQTEPEWTLQVQSPEFFCQLWAVTMAAKAMPSDVWLAVKEHIYPIGARPHNFYDQIVEFKNIKMMSAGIHGLDVIKKSIGVITINGSSGYEAALLGIPAIVLAEKCDYAFLDHVQHCPQGRGLEEAVRRIYNNEFNSEKMKNDGARFLQAIINSSFSIYDYSVLNRQKIDPAAINNAIMHLEATL